jgi:hypothetical protein
MSAMSTVLSRWLATTALLLASSAAGAQSLPVSVSVAGNVATVQVGDPLTPLAEVTLTFDDATGLTASSLGLSAKLVDVSDPALLARLPDPTLTRLDSALPLMITVEPPATGGLSFRRSGRFELHTHALSYSLGSNFRVLKAPVGGKFRDTTEEIAQGSVRARSRYGGFSQFLVVSDLRQSSAVIAEKIASLRTRVSTLPLAEQPAFTADLDAVESALAKADYVNALTAVDLISQRALERDGHGLLDEWRATRDADNQVGELLAGAASLKFSIAYLRDYGQ